MLTSVMVGCLHPSTHTNGPTDCRWTHQASRYSGLFNSTTSWSLRFVSTQRDHPSASSSFQFEVEEFSSTRWRHRQSELRRFVHPARVLQYFSSCPSQARLAASVRSTAVTCWWRMTTTTHGSRLRGSAGAFRSGSTAPWYLVECPSNGRYQTPPPPLDAYWRHLRPMPLLLINYKYGRSALARKHWLLSFYMQFITQ